MLSGFIMRSRTTGEDFPMQYRKDKYGNEITVIEPVFYRDIDELSKEYIRDLVNGDDDDFKTVQLDDRMRCYGNWYANCIGSERVYFRMLKYGATPEEARSVLPNSLKTEIVVTANMREWRHILSLRAAGTTGKPHDKK